jgi:hypothetical protein
VKRRQDVAPECDMCAGNRQLLQQLLADVGELKRLLAAKPMRIEVIDGRGGHVAGT